MPLTWWLQNVLTCSNHPCRRCFRCVDNIFLDLPIRLRNVRTWDTSSAISSRPRSLSRKRSTYPRFLTDNRRTTARPRPPSMVTRATRPASIGPRKSWLWSAPMRTRLPPPRPETSIRRRRFRYSEVALAEAIDWTCSTSEILSVNKAEKWLLVNEQVLILIAFYW